MFRTCRLFAVCIGQRARVAIPRLEDLKDLRQSVQHGRAIWGEAKFARTDTQGNYRFGGLPEGVYAVYNDPLLESEPATTLVEPGSDSSVARNGYPTVFYPDAHELAGAARLRLAAGDQARANMTLTLEPFHTVTATVLSPDGRTLTLTPGATAGSGGAAPVPALLDTEGHTLAYDAHYDDTTHTVQATLPDGTYTLTVVLRGGGSEGESAQGYHPHTLVGAAEFAVAGQAVRNLRIPLFTPHSALLRLRAQRGGALPSAGLGAAVRVALSYAGEYRMDTGEELSAVDAGPDAFDLMLAPPFSYWVHTLVYGKGLCAGALNANGPDLAREPLVLSFAGSAAPMELTVRNDCAQLNLSLPAAAAALVPGIEPVYTAYVVPDFDTTADVQPVTLRPSSGGSLTVEGLTPGGYHVYTFAAPVELEYRNPAALGQLGGQAVTLTPGAAENLVLEAPGR
jgi:hypothetical protein